LKKTRGGPGEKGKVRGGGKEKRNCFFLCWWGGGGGGVAMTLCHYAKGNITQRLILELYVNGFESNPSNCFYILPCRMISARLLQRGRQRA